MKSFLKKVVLLLLVLTCVAGLFSCKDNTDSMSGSMRLVVGERVYEVDLEEVKGAEGLLSVLSYLHDTQGLAYTVEGKGENAYLTKVGEVEQNSDEGKYVYLYTNMEEDYDVSIYALTKEWNGNTLTSSGVGAGALHICDGTIILVDYIEW